MRGRGRYIFPALIFLVGLAILLYPVASDLWNRLAQSRLVSSYEQQLDELDDDTLEQMLAAAQAYNASLDPSFSDAFSGERPAGDDAYWNLLDPDGTGIMGYLEIPKIGQRLPIYHDTSEDVLQQGAGHLAGTSLPVGGAGTHCVIAAHRGLPTAQLFTDLDQLQQGDRFALHVLGQTLAYEVDQVLVAEPDEVGALKPDTSGDYVTLLTCTPYGVNTQRLLVRGHRVVDMGNAGQVTAADEVWASLGLKGKIALALLALIVAVLIARAIRNRSNNHNARKGAHFS